MTSRAKGHNTHRGEKEQHSELRCEGHRTHLGRERKAKRGRTHGREHTEATHTTEPLPLLQPPRPWQLGLRSGDYVIGTADGYFWT